MSYNKSDSRNYNKKAKLAGGKGSVGSPLNGSSGLSGLPMGAMPFAQQVNWQPFDEGLVINDDATMGILANTSNSANAMAQDIRSASLDPLDAQQFATLLPGTLITNPELAGYWGFSVDKIRVAFSYLDMQNPDALEYGVSPNGSLVLSDGTKRVAISRMAIQPFNSVAYFKKKEKQEYPSEPKNSVSQGQLPEQSNSLIRNQADIDGLAQKAEDEANNRSPPMA